MGLLLGYLMLGFVMLGFVMLGFVMLEQWVAVMELELGGDWIDP